MLERFSQRARRRQEEERREALMDSVRSTQSALSRAYDGFNRTADPDLVEAYVYEINALQCRYAYLLKQVRQLDGAAAAGPR